MTRWYASLLVTTWIMLGVVGFPPFVGAQLHAHHVAATSQHHDVTAFLSAAREGTRRYHTLDSAIADGYRRIGDDLPSMGEHWIHPARVMSGRVDRSRPSILIYARGGGGPLLAGVGWTTVLAPGETYPDFPAGPGAWHEHNGTVDEETLPLSHAARVASSADTRVAILHAWVWVANPRGVWNADNWMLPFVRAGLQPDSAQATAARALSLAPHGAVEHYARVIATSVGGDTAERSRASAALQRAADEVRAELRGVTGVLDAAAAHRLEYTWGQLWVRLGDGDDAARAARLRELQDLLR